MYTRMNDPFIYFFMEPNVIFVYEILSLDYLTITDLEGGHGWATYEVNQSSDFDSFNHENSEPLSGYGYFINQDDLHLMTIEINKYIKKKKVNSQQIDPQPMPVHLVTSESAAGALRVGLDRPKHVIGFQDSFAIGPLWKLDETIGQSHRNEWFYDHINLEQPNDYEFQNQFSKSLLEIDDIREQDPIYIWTGNNVEEQIGIRFILYLLRNKTNDCYIINSTDSYISNIKPMPINGHIYYTSQIKPNDLNFLFKQNQKINPLSQQDKEKYVDEWENLSQSTLVLRILSQGEIMNVSEDYYDDQILELIKGLKANQDSNHFVKTGAVIAEFLNISKMPVNPFYLEYRIRDMVYNGRLELKGVPRSMRHYSVRLK
ncbi:DUF1835 domain-containing protein [Bacillus sp. PS06]|uniref:DUF1835 domain-containing protein n=1 Tax=Bacillus sp. PS06 TaxID=2764176 RepID=UPI00177BDD98|nr:DUF1835 domain-containing protein [Bacillus sp. PS06]MBD8070143.1 DUF1835 domain-containing protein [Bacillus sp. PS06]